MMLLVNTSFFLSLHSLTNLIEVNYWRINNDEKIMKKRPCCICRKWFLPDIRQKDRQKTCGCPKCKAELHRRNCRKWNNRNKEYFANNYLENKIEQLEKRVPEEDKKVTLPASPLFLPVDTIVKEYGARKYAM